MSSTTRPDRREREPVVPDSTRQQQFIDTLQELDAVVWEMDPTTWTFTYVSERAERLFGYPLERWTEPGFWQEVLLDERDRDWCIGFCATATDERRDHAFLYRARTADGRTLWLKDVVRVVPGDGSAAVLRGVMQDVTEHYGEGRQLEGKVLDYDDPSLAALRKVLAA